MVECGGKSKFCIFREQESIRFRILLIKKKIVLELWLNHLIALCPLAGHLNSLVLRYLISKKVVGWFHGYNSTYLLYRAVVKIELDNIQERT